VHALAELKHQLSVEIDKKSCASSLRIANEIYAIDPRDVLALQTIVKCTRSEQSINVYAAQAKEIFEQSRIFSIVPKLLEVAQVKDLVPILREVEVKEDKSIADYLMITEIYERLGDPEKQVATLQEAIKANPGDVRVLFLLAQKNFQTNRGHETGSFIKTYFENIGNQPGQFYLVAYALALAYPLSLCMALVVTVWGLGWIISRRKSGFLKDWPELQLCVPILMTVVPLLLAWRFWQTGKALPLGALLLLISCQTFALFRPILSWLFMPAFRLIAKAFFTLFNGSIFAKRLASLTSGTRLLISLISLLFIGIIAPTIDIPDLKFGSIVLCSIVLYTTIGSLIVSFLRSRESLVVSLRWIGIAATIPFLGSYLISDWQNIGTPLLYGKMPLPSAIDSFTSYLIFWGTSFVLALHLGKIIAQAFIQPINEIIEKVALIEKGQFEAKVDVASRDELGHLARAINRMGSGLGKREKIEKTFRKYVDHKIAERILEGVESELRIGGQNVNAVVLFADIRGFTTMAEKSSPEEVVAVLNEFFERMVKIVRRNGGVIDKFIGDNMMAVWGIPYPIMDAEKKAITAGIEMLKDMQSWNQELSAQGRPELAIGIGVNVGAMIAGSIGSSDHMEYTVIGDTVNTAQRAESIAQKHQMILTEAMYSKVKQFVHAQPLEPLKVKGKEQLQHWWSVTAEQNVDLSAPEKAS
jgi:class 3 adenylate cyclase